MKKQVTYFLMLFIALAFTQLNAQGSFIGVDLGFSSTKDVHTGFHIAPTYGYKLSSTMQIVGRVGFESHTDKTNNDAKETGLGVGAEFRYGTRPSDNFFLFAALGVGFNSTKDDNGTDTENDDVKGTEINFGIRPGIDYMFNDKWSMTAHFGRLGYSSDKTEVGSVSPDPVGTFSLDLSMSSLAFGLFYHF